MLGLVVGVMASITGCAVTPVEWPYLARYPNGSLHPGVDLRGRSGEPVRAPRAGRVAWAQPNQEGVAARITIDHEWQGEVYQTQYYHISDPLVRTGQWVTQGQIIAELALTGERGPADPRRITHYHLHLEVYRDSRRGDPERLIPWSCPVKGQKVEWSWPVGC